MYSDTGEPCDDGCLFDCPPQPCSSLSTGTCECDDGTTGTCDDGNCVGEDGQNCGPDDPPPDDCPPGSAGMTCPCADGSTGTCVGGECVGEDGQNCCPDGGCGPIDPPPDGDSCRDKEDGEPCDDCCGQEGECQNGECQCECDGGGIGGGGSCTCDNGTPSQCNGECCECCEDEDDCDCIDAKGDPEKEERVVGLLVGSDSDCDAEPPVGCSGGANQVCDTINGVDYLYYCRRFETSAGVPLQCANQCFENPSFNQQVSVQAIGNAEICWQEDFQDRQEFNQVRGVVKLCNSGCGGLRVRVTVSTPNGTCVYEVEKWLTPPGNTEFCV